MPHGVRGNVIPAKAGIQLQEKPRFGGAFSFPGFVLEGDHIDYKRDHMIYKGVEFQ
jgi:hypothetical protein